MDAPGECQRTESSKRDRRPARVRSPILIVALALALVPAGCGGDDDGGEGEASPAPEDAGSPGLQVWMAQGCGSCHTLAAANATGTTGPNLDEQLAGRSKDFIRESIVEPDAEIASNFSAGLMPEDYGEKLSDEQLRQLVDFLAESAG
jgi:cytochrome c oxidase subunit 2